MPPTTRTPPPPTRCEQLGLCQGAGRRSGCTQQGLFIHLCHERPHAMPDTLPDTMSDAIDPEDEENTPQPPGRQAWQALRAGGPVGLGYWWRLWRLQRAHQHVMNCLRREQALHREYMAVLHQQRLRLLDEQQRVNVAAAQFWRAAR